MRRHPQLSAPPERATAAYPPTCSHQQLAAACSRYSLFALLSHRICPPPGHNTLSRTLATPHGRTGQDTRDHEAYVPHTAVGELARETNPQSRKRLAFRLPEPHRECIMYVRTAYASLHMHPASYQTEKGGLAQSPPTAGGVGRNDSSSSAFDDLQPWSRVWRAPFDTPSIAEFGPGNGGWESTPVGGVGRRQGRYQPGSRNETVL